MAGETQTAPANNGEVVQKFLQFVMMQAQNILFVLGKIPTQDGRVHAPNLDAAKMLIDQLDVIKIKTRGNLNKQEQDILDEALSSVQMAFVEASGGTPASMMPSRSTPAYAAPEEEEEVPAAENQAQPDSQAEAKTVEPGKSEEKSGENKVKFHKSYG